MTRAVFIITLLLFSLFCSFGCAGTSVTSAGDVATNDGDTTAASDTTAPDGGDTLLADELLPDDDQLGDDADIDVEAFVPYTEIRFEWELIRKAVPASDTTLFPSRTNAAAVSYDGYIWLFGGTDHHDAWRSADGTAWNKVAEAIEPSIVGDRTVTVHAGELWTVTDEGVWKSADGETWTLLTAEPAFCKRTDFSLISWQDALWMIGGRSECAEGGEVWRSTDGVIWERKAQFAGPTVPSGGPCTMYGDGIVDTTPLIVDDTLLLFGGHYPGECVHDGFPPDMNMGCTQDIYRYEAAAASISPDGAVGDVPCLASGWPLTGGTAFYHHGKYWLLGGTRYTDDTVEQMPYPGGATTYTCITVPPDKKDMLSSSLDGMNWDLNAAVLPFSVIEAPVMTYHDEAIWIVGADSTNEVWRGSEHEVTITDPSEAECSRGRYPDEVLLTAQSVADLEELRGYTDLPDLEITAESPDLSMLHCLRSIGSLTIRLTATLGSLKGLERLMTVRGTLTIDGNGELSDIGALASLLAVGGDIVIINDPALAEIRFPALGSFDGQLTITDNAALTTISGFPNIATSSAIKLVVRYCPLLTDAEPFSRIVRAQSIELAELSSAIVFPALERVGDLSCRELSLGADTFPVLQQVDNDLNISHCTLSSFALSSLESVGAALRLTQCGGFNGADIFPALSAVNTITIDLLLDDIKTLSGFSKIMALYEISLMANHAVTALKAFSSLTMAVKVGVSNHNSLASLQGLDALEVVEDLDISHIAALSSLKDLSSLNEIKYTFNITGNDILTDVSRLEQLTAFTGIDDSNTAYSYIRDNPMLAPCAADKVIAHLVNDLGANPANFSVQGNTGTLPCN